MPSWHSPDSDSGMVQDDESTIKVHNNAKSCFFWIPLDYVRVFQTNNNNSDIVDYYIMYILDWSSAPGINIRLLMFLIINF